jgi:hypothetical protein
MALQSVIAQKSAIADREKQLIANLNRVLPDMGYRVVPIAEGDGAERARRAHPASGRPIGPVREADKVLPCPHCPRKFAHPLHLGRHVGAMHRGQHAANGKHAGRPAAKKEAARQRPKRTVKPARSA